MTSSDGDDAPEGISFKHGKENALDIIQSIKNSLNRDKKLKKEKRRAIEQRNIKQKKQKVLAPDFLEQVDEAIEENRSLKYTKFIEKDDDDEIYFPQEDSIVDEEEMDKTNDYISLNKTQRFIKQPEVTAVEFKKQMLYRDQNRRMKCSEMKLVKAKRAAANNRSKR